MAMDMRELEELKMSSLTEELESVSAKSVLLEAYTELNSGMLFMRARVPADKMDNETDDNCGDDED